MTSYASVNSSVIDADSSGAIDSNQSDKDASDAWAPFGQDDAFHAMTQIAAPASAIATPAPLSIEGLYRLVTPTKVFDAETAHQNLVQAMASAPSATNPFHFSATSDVFSSISVPTLAASGLHT